MKCFVDTNLLLYAKDTTHASKQKRASDWMSALSERRAVVLSAQSLREFYVNMLRQSHSAGALRNLRAEVAALDNYVPEALRIDRMTDAWRLQDRHKLNFWDSLLLASALAGGCSVFLSEDLNNGQKIETLTIVDPFTTAPDAVLGAI
jgi:predicted nucleic acid-binding protein